MAAKLIWFPCLVTLAHSVRLPSASACENPATAESREICFPAHFVEAGKQNDLVAGAKSEDELV